ESLRGFPNTKATFTLFRPSENREKTYTLTREIIEIETVTYEKLEDQIAHIRIASFSKQTNDQLEAALDQAKKDGALSFILDLRDNPGGLLTQSVKVASHFTSDDRLIVYTKGRDAGQYQEYHAENKGNLQNMPVVILVNQYSASASEIVAGALRDAGKALVMGETSYGKGSVQTIFRINDGAGLRITTSKYFTPSGIDITEYGIIPDIMIEKTDPEPAGDPKPGEERIKPKPSLPGLPAIRLKLSDVTKLLQDQGIVVDNGHDPLLRFAQSTIKNIRVANKKVTLEKARELAANIQYESTPLNR
ncbi:MAG: peptidase S41, partial [Nitrospinae bacterium CG11_big_fil_rev_8_21_14_0_20_56_8]